MPELLGDHHLTYWWSFVCQHQRPGTDIHADQSDISLNFWITPDSANLAPGRRGLEMWNVAAPSDWTFNDYNADGYRIRLHLSQIGAQRKSFPYAENRGLLFNGMLFHQTAELSLRRRLREPAAQHHHAVPSQSGGTDSQAGLTPRHTDRAQIFLLVDRQISDAAASDCLGNLAPELNGPGNLALATSSSWAMAGASRPANSGFSPGPLPVIGVRRAILQSRAHDDAHRTLATARGALDFPSALLEGRAP